MESKAGFFSWPISSSNDSNHQFYGAMSVPQQGIRRKILIRNAEDSDDSPCYFHHPLRRYGENTCFFPSNLWLP